MTEEKWPHAKWAEFNTWLAPADWRRSADWAHDYVRQHGHVLPGAEAPESAAKRRSVMAVDERRRELVYDLGTSLAASKEHHVVRLDKIRPWLAEMKSADPRYGEPAASSWRRRRPSRGRSSSPG